MEKFECPDCNREFKTINAKKCMKQHMNSRKCLKRKFSGGGNEAVLNDESKRREYASGPVCNVSPMKSDTSTLGVIVDQMQKQEDRIRRQEDMIQMLQNDVLQMRTQLAKRESPSVQNMTINDNSTTTNNNNNSIHLHVYGTVPEHFPTNQRVTEFMRTPRSAIPKYIQALFFERPDMRCIRKPSVKRKVVEVRTAKNKVECRSEKDVVHDLLRCGNLHLHQRYKEVKTYKEFLKYSGLLGGEMHEFRKQEDKKMTGFPRLKEQTEAISLVLMTDEMRGQHLPVSSVGEQTEQSPVGAQPFEQSPLSARDQEEFVTTLSKEEDQIARAASMPGKARSAVKKPGNGGSRSKPKVEATEPGEPPPLPRPDVITVSGDIHGVSKGRYIKHEKNMYGLESFMKKRISDTGGYKESDLFSVGCLTFIYTDEDEYRLAAVKGHGEKPYARQLHDGRWTVEKKGEWSLAEGARARY